MFRGNAHSNAGRLALTARWALRASHLFAATLLLGVAGDANAMVIYQHDFLGSGSDPLNEVPVEGGTAAGTPWVAEAAWFADGHVEVGADEFDAANAFLPFDPAPGRKYLLSTTLTAAGDTFNFLTLGFMNNPTVDTFSDQAGGPWMLKRGQGSGFQDEVYTALDSTLNGAEDLSFHGPFPGATQLSMELNTQLPQWTVEFFINGSSVRGPENIDPAATPITHVGVSRYVNPVTGTAAAFSLTEDDQPLPFRLTVDRTTGEMAIVNETGSAINNVIGYTISSTSGALDHDQWVSVAGNYDAASNGGDQSVDNQVWAVQNPEAGPYELSEAATAGSGGAISASTPVDLGMTWIKGLQEDLLFQVLINDGTPGGNPMDVQVVFEPGADNLQPFEFGDLDFDGDIDADDFQDVFVDAYLSNTTGFSPAQAYAAGDLNGDGLTNAIDFVIFNQAYLAANPQAAPLPAHLLGNTAPEPQALALLVLTGVVGLLRNRSTTTARAVRMARPLTLAGGFVVALFALAPSPADAQLSITNGDFQTAAVAPGSFDVGDLPEWFDTGAMLRLDGDYDGGGGDELPTASGDTLLAIESAFDYAYQNLGPISSGTNQIEVTFDAIERAVFLDLDETGIDNINRFSSSVQLDLFVGSFAGADGVDIALTKSPVGSVTIDPASMFSTLDTNGPSDPEGPIEVTAVFEDAYFAPGTDVWLRASSPDAEVSATGISIQIDNLSVAEVEAPGVDYPLELVVNKTTGEVRLQNNSGEEVAIDVFRVLSSGGSLDPNAWDGISGSGWTDLGSISQELSQAHLGSGVIADNADLDLGDAYTGGESEDLVFTFHVAGTEPDLFLSSPVTYIVDGGLIGDYNEDNVVDSQDYAVWRESLGTAGPLPNRDPGSTGLVSQADFDAWLNNYGAAASSMPANNSVAPEPATGVMLLVLCAAVAGSRRNRF